MTFQADIIVMAPDVPDVTLVAQIKKGRFDEQATEAHLKEYMLRRKCSLALLVTPEKTRIYRDTFADFTPASITLVGEYGTTEVLGVDVVPEDERGLHDAVQGWLERLAASWPSALPTSQAARESVIQYVVPGVAEGRVSSGSLG
jgi:hypothetical protein